MKNLPSYLIKKLPKQKHIRQIRSILADDSIHSVCEAAKCPNIGECFKQKTVTFMILGDVCTRSCSFCGVSNGLPKAVDPDEPRKIAVASQKLELEYIVITSVTRDDLPDGGADQFRKVIQALKEKVVEVLIPDFFGNINSLKLVVKAGPQVINHNLETVERLYPLIRPQADYLRSLNILSRIKAQNPNICTKSGFMVGLGEEEAEVKKLLDDLREVNTDIVTIGQYLPPSKNHFKLKKFVTPDEFSRIKQYGEKIGLKHVEAGPFVRSSFKAEEIWKKLNACKSYRSMFLQNSTA